MFFKLNLTILIVYLLAFSCVAQTSQQTLSENETTESIFREALGYDLVENDDRDIEKAIELYSIASDQGDSTAQATMAYVYAYGGLWHSGVHPRNPAKAFKMAKASANTNNGLGMAVLSVLHSEGIGTKYDPEKGIQLLMSAEKQLAKLAKEKVPAAMEFLAELYFRKKRFKDSLNLTKWAYSHGYVVATYALGNMNLQLGQRADAKKHFEEAARFGHPAAIYKLANVAFPKGPASLNNDDAKSFFKQLKRAAVLQHPPAMRVVGKLYLEGIGTTKDVSIGLDWLEKAAELNDAESLISLGIIHKVGLHNCPANAEKAISLYRKAADRGNADGAFFLAFEYLEIGRLQRTIQWLNTAADLGHPKAQEIVNKSATNLLGKKIVVPRLPGSSAPANDWLQDPYYADPEAYKEAGKLFGKTGPEMRMWEEDMRNRNRNYGQ